MQSNQNACDCNCWGRCGGEHFSPPIVTVRMRGSLVNTMSSQSSSTVMKRWPNCHVAAAKWIRIILLSLLFRYSNCLAAIHDFPKGTNAGAVTDVMPQTLSVGHNITNRFIKNVSISYSYTPKNKTNARIDFSLGLTNGSISGARMQSTVASDRGAGGRRRADNSTNGKQQEISLENMDKQENQLGNSDDIHSSGSINGNSELEEMSFGTQNYTTVTTQIGSTSTMLTCTVHNIGEGVVSWIRRSKDDYHLLTVGMTTYSSDERFNAIHRDDSDEWTLQIKFVQMRDSGVYECQVSSHPPSSIMIQLDVVEARAEITGPAEKYLKPGSTLRLACRVQQSTEPPLYIFWYHNNRMINYDSDRGVNVTTEADNRYSELLIDQTSYSHAGNYSCVPNSAVPASTVVHIFNGENPAAIHHVGHGYPVLSSAPTRLVILTVVILILIS
ncbi:uncharacterized protein LOC132257522 isoform X1 [Phlebotomus argentipes]|uniref:uncharacterized protein LOC132257522 isoform X1 n=2 Tax=Phlebotomus argentipes TaxID=94469 RepID=UPI0028937C00|nr:uncharacterized protein LOC132257522 isoform X1 [Phlebotomus argentipes]XP_059610451.1 uncharacterized protein LOC132257522 isoform X1 [Phlebotomus argentipes]